MSLTTEFICYVFLANLSFAACTDLGNCLACKDTNENGEADGVDECTQCVDSYILDSGKCISSSKI